MYSIEAHLLRQIYSCAIIGILLAGFFMFAFIEPNAQNPVYSHYPKRETSDFDPAKADSIFLILEGILRQPIQNAGADAAKVVSPAKSIGWEKLADANYQFKLRNYQGAFQLAEAAIELAKTSGDRSLEMKGFGTVGAISRDVFLGHSLVAVPHHEKALDLAYALEDSVYTIIQLNSLADNYLQSGQYDRFLEYFGAAIPYLETISAPVSQIRAGILFGIFLTENEQYNRSNKMFRLAMNIASKIGREDYVQHLYLQLCDVSLLANKPAAAEVFLDSAIIKGLVLDDFELDEKRYVIEKLRGNDRQAFEYLEKAYSGVGESYLKRSAEQIAGIETGLRTREQQLALEHQEQLLKSKEKTRQLLLGLLILISILLLIISISWHQQRKAKRILSKQHKLIEQQATELKKVDVLKSRFFVNISHELRTPLTMILGPLSSVLKSDNIGKNQKALLKMAQQSSVNLMNLIGDILKLSKLKSGKLEQREKEFFIWNFLEGLIMPFQNKAIMKGVKLKMNFLPPKDICIYSDPEHLGTIITNLLINAIKFTQSGGSISLRVEAMAKTIRFEVSDNGRGISQDDLPHIFDRYFQSKQMDTPLEGGTGIGLALSKELLELLGGKIWVKSTLGQGSSFYVDIPAKKAPIEHHKPDLAQEETTALIASSIIAKLEMTAEPETSEKVLVVEDDPGLREYISFILADKYKVVSAQNGNIALEYLNQEVEKDPVKLIISDIMMSQMDGYQLLENLKSDWRWRHIPVIMLSARAGKQDRLKALRMGVDDYLIKPFEEDELLARVANLLANHWARQAFKKYNQEEGITAFQAADSDSGQMAWLEQLEAIVFSQIQDSNFTLDSLSASLSLSRRQFQRRLKAATGLTATAYLLELRLQRARHLIELGELPAVKDLAPTVGFRDVKYFSKAFKNRFGISPSKYTVSNN